MENLNEKAKKRVLVVDDEPDILKAVSFILGKAGYDVVTAGDGAAALELVKKEKFDLVLLDVVMPGLDGFAFLKTVRNDTASCNVPILVVSGRSGMSDTFITFGADGFIVKPMAPETLVAQAELFTRDRAILLTTSPYLEEKVSRIFQKQGYEISIIAKESDILKVGQEKRYKCIIAHISSIESPPEKFKEMTEKLLKYKKPMVILYSDSSVKSLENNSTVAIESEITKWSRAGIKTFYDARVVLKPLSSLLKDWVFDNTSL